MIRQNANRIPENINTEPSLYMFGKGVIIANIVTLILFVIFAFLLTYTSFPDMYLPMVTQVSTLISVAIASSLTTRNLRNNGWLNGGIIGMLYVVLLYLTGSIFLEDFSISGNIFTLMILSVFTGAVGGIIGVNLRKR